MSTRPVDEIFRTLLTTGPSVLLRDGAGLWDAGSDRTNRRNLDPAEWSATLPYFTFFGNRTCPGGPEG
jgi:hypothetical protein